MMQNQNTSHLKRWGFVCMVVSFFALFGGLFQLGGWWWDTMVIAGIFLAAPPITRQANWGRRIAEFVAALVVLFLLLAGGLWLAQTNGLNPGELLAALTLLFGIVLQTWGELKDKKTADKSYWDVFLDNVRKI
jgi:hypothetical protein